MFRIKTNKPGKTVTIMGGVHGNEVCGVSVVGEFSKKLKINRGIVNLIIGNPKAVVANTRHVEMNLNRAFLGLSCLTKAQRATYESKRAKEIMPYLKESDALLDIHSSGTPGSVPFIICEEHSYEVVKYLPFKIVTSGWDNLEPGATDGFVNKNGGQGICVECGHHDDPKAIETARKTAMVFLWLLGIKGKPKNFSTVRQTFVKMWHIHITKNNFELSRNFKDFEKIKKGTLIGADGSKKIKAPKDCYILFARNRQSAGEEAFLLGELVNNRQTKTLKVVT